MRFLFVVLFMLQAINANGQEPTQGQEKGAPAIEPSVAEPQRPIDPSPPSNGIERAIRDPIAADNTPQSREHEAEKRDPEAREAFWAPLMFLASIGTVGAAVVGVFYIRTTLLEIRRIGRAETKAYLSIEGDGYIAVQGFITIKFKIANSGNSPAREVKIGYVLEAHVGACGEGNKPVFETLSTIPKTIHVPDIQAGGSRPIRIDLDQDTFTGDDWDRIRDHIGGGQFFTIGVAAHWTDVFGERETSFTALHSGGSAFDEQAGSVVVDGKLTEDRRTS